MSGKNFAGLWGNLSSRFSDTQQREKLEDMAVMLASVDVAEAIPGVGEVQMALQFLDFIDPYGYNQALTRSSLNGLMVDQYQKIEDMQAQVAKCFGQFDQAACAVAGISPSDMASFQQLPPTLQQKQLKSLTSWVTPYPPELNDPNMMLCTLATDPDTMSRCGNDYYKTTYQNYFNQNAAQYEANAEAAHQAAINQAAAGLSGDPTVVDSNNGHLKRIGLLMIVGWLVMVIGFFLVSKRVLK